MKRFDRTYFDKWYRDPVHKVGTDDDLARQVRLAISAAEYMLMRPITSVLDAGAGEGRWQPLIAKFRPDADYVGVDPSEYSIQRYGQERNLKLGTIDDLDKLFPTYKFDLVVCCSVLNYLPRKDFVRALDQLARRTGGLAFLEIFSAEDEVVGDTHLWYAEPSKTYKKLLKKAGFVHCGLHCYITNDIESNTAALELA